MDERESHDFASSINNRSEISKFYASIGSVNIIYLSCDIYFDNENPLLI